MQILLDLNEAEVARLLHIIEHPVTTNYYGCECSDCLKGEVLLKKIRKAVDYAQAQRVATH